MILSFFLLLTWILMKKSLLVLVKVVEFEQSQHIISSDLFFQKLFFNFFMLFGQIISKVFVIFLLFCLFKNISNYFIAFEIRMAIVWWKKWCIHIFLLDLNLQVIFNLSLFIKLRDQILSGVRDIVLQFHSFIPFHQFFHHSFLLLCSNKVLVIVILFKHFFGNLFSGLPILRDILVQIKNQGHVGPYNCKAQHYQNDKY